MLAKPVAESVFDSINLQVSKLSQLKTPKLSVIIIGSDSASQVYVSNKEKKAKELGFQSEVIKLSETVTADELKKILTTLNEDKTVSGVLVQRPVPKHIPEDQLVFWIHPDKDVDSFHPENIGKLSLGLPALTSCTPLGVMYLLKHYGIELTGKIVCVVGRSSIVGKPMAQLLINANATVIQCHSKTNDLKHWTQQADIVIAALGKKQFLKKEHFKKNTTVIDVGIHRNADNSLCGDVDPTDLDGYLYALTPVPGGVGPMTIAMLMQNTLDAALHQQGIKI